MAEENQVFVYNKGKRTWDIPIAWNEEQPTGFVQIGPGQSKELPESVAEHYTKRYSRDLMMGQGLSMRKADPRIAELEQENAELKAQIEELQKKDLLSEKDKLIIEAESLGLEFDKRIGVDKLKELIEEAKKNG